MDQHYDVLVCGTGFTECILSGLCSMNQMSVLHIDKNNFYGSETASLSLNEFIEQYGGEVPSSDYKNSRQWYIDQVPKFVMGDGVLVKILIASGVSRYLEWRNVEGSFIYKPVEASMFHKAKKLHKIPSTASEALQSPVLGLTEKLGFVRFLNHVLDYSEEDKSTHAGIKPGEPMSKVYEYFSISKTMQEFVGHAIALESSNDYLNKSSSVVLRACQLYWSSLAKYEHSPFLYPCYGLGDLPQGFSRLSALHNGTFMLSTSVDKFLYNENGKVCGAQFGDQSITCDKILCDPTYALKMPELKDDIKVTGTVLRSVCLLDHPVPETKDAGSAQIILTAGQLKRKNDIYVNIIGSNHRVAPAGWYIAIVSTVSEGNQSYDQLKPAIDLLGSIKRCTNISVPIYDCSKCGIGTNVFVSDSYDAQSHFESATKQATDLWERFSGSKLRIEDLKPAPIYDDEQENQSN